MYVFYVYMYTCLLYILAMYYSYILFMFKTSKKINKYIFVRKKKSQNLTEYNKRQSEKNKEITQNRYVGKVSKGRKYLQ